jgi:hypothetical protein
MDDSGAMTNQMKDFSSIHEELPNIEFQYTEIDEMTLEELRKQDLHEPVGSQRVELKKWCIATHYPIALLYAGWVSSCIARTDDNRSFWYFLLIVNGMQTRIEFTRQGMTINAEKDPIIQNEIKISVDFAGQCGFKVEQLKRAVCEAIKVFEIGRCLDLEEERKQRGLEQARRTPDKIMHGEFSTILRQCIDSITEVEDMEQLFRSLCLRHFKEFNLAVQHFNGFYLHGDEDSLFIFDVILWMYLHINRDATIEGFMSNYPCISNEKNSYLRDDFEKHFCLGGAISFLKEHYFPRRIEEQKIVMQKGNVRFSPRYLEAIVQQLKCSN